MGPYGHRWSIVTGKVNLFTVEAQIPMTSQPRRFDYLSWPEAKEAAKINCKETNKWPKINEKVLENLKINMVIQVNGKTRDVLNIKKDLNEKEINKLTMNSSKANKHLENKKIIKTIFIKNKIINYIINN